MDNLTALAALFTSILTGFGILYVNSRNVSKDEIARLQARILSLEEHRDKLEARYEVLYQHHLDLKSEFAALKPQPQEKLL